MLDWLYNSVYGLFGSISGPVKDFVHSIVRAILGSLNAVAGRMWTVWWYMVTAATEFTYNLFQFAFQMYSAAWWMIRHAVPKLWRAVGDLWDGIVAVRNWVVEGLTEWINYVKDLAWSWVQDAIAWVVEHVWRPVVHWIEDLYDKMTRWAFTAYWYVTHPDDLAAVLFWALFGVFARNAFPVARYIGDWLLRTFLQAVPASIRLVEQIITDVL